MKKCENIEKLWKYLKIVIVLKNCENIEKLWKYWKIVKILKNCEDIFFLDCENI